MVLRSPGPSLPSADIWMWPDKESCKVQSPGHSGHHLGRYKESSGTTAPVSWPSVHSYSLAQGDKERTTLETNINFLAKTSLHLWNIYKLWQSTISGYWIMFGIPWRHFSFICAPFHKILKKMFAVFLVLMLASSCLARPDPYQRRRHYSPSYARYHSNNNNNNVRRVAGALLRKGRFWADMLRCNN